MSRVFRLRYLFIFSLLFFVFPQASRAQSQHTLSGLVRGADGAVLPGATVAVPALGLGAATEADGKFSISLPDGPQQVVVSFVGYTTQTLALTIHRNQQHVFTLAAADNALDEVLVHGQQTLKEKLTTTQMGVEHLSIREAKLLPALFGEVDVLKTLQLKPGVQSGGEGTSGLFVRGGSSDQNLVLLDNALVYNPNHLFGLFSVFNSDAVQSVDLYKAGFPAQFGGRLSSVVDVRLREGDRQKFTTTGGIGLISSRLSFEGPLNKGKGSFIVSGRRTYFDIFTRALNRANAGKEDYSPIPDYYFYDFNAKANYTLGAKDQLFFTGYLGRDIFGFTSPNGFKSNFSWGNTLGVVRWQHVFSPKLTVNTAASVTSYKYDLNNSIDQFSFNLGSTILDYTGRTDFDYVPNDRHTLKFGAMFTAHDFGVGRLQRSSQDNSVNYGADVNYTGQEGGLYATDNIKVSDKLQTELGLRFSGFHSGTDTYGGLEPRASARYSLSNKVTLKSSYALMYQYVHLVSNSGASLPTDIWYPSRLSVKPERSQQVSSGISFLLGGGKFLLTDEVYYKWAKNVIDFKDGAQIFANNNLDTQFLFGRGWSYGNELYLEKTQGKTTGWIGYTLAWTKRNFPPQLGTTGINNGQDFYPNYDRRHNLTVVVLHQLSTRISLTASFVYTSGAPTTLPQGRFALQDIYQGGIQAVPIYPDRNSYRLISYHRLDLGMVYKLRPSRMGGDRDLTFSIYNAYNRRNAYFIYFDQTRDKATDKVTGYQAKQVSLFPIIPSVTYNFKF
ncbi:TonB-dependent receptor plug domain-containing protein [Hymenobacter sp. HMF4947]|uniref:TonB-dependent receptor plug domain-containing protein n=1 Tax=Hymenobacter ginkgonis TaxID=2682976 RepID=A0A7K1TA73_9BACT|nr:TonB-dependent receptor [Hymenobacter ginkgonis]MVN75295.1 TonB-dependent receptor plug domain-containing protein [Hymenobacter ginkgonis]